ncbi:MAG: hypothetical protein J1F31_05485 [Erysipelotrichales bacterium]|nr:hypothetical protein [Erysipelotrichales bacterium]
MNIKIQNNELKDNKIISLPGSKSITIRALFCAFLADSSSTIINSSICEDVLATIDVLNKLGGRITRKGNKIIVNKRIEIDKNRFKINVKSSATLLRFIIPLFLVLFPNKELTILMNRDLYLRPLDGFNRLFEENEIYTKNEDGKLIICGELKNDEITIDGGKSSQFISGMLIALSKRNVDTHLKITDAHNSKGYIDMTVKVMEQFNIKCDLDFIRGNQIFNGKEVVVEPDYSNAALFFALALKKEKTTFKNIKNNSIQPDAKILNLLKDVGANIEKQDDTLIIYKSTLQGFNLDLNNCIDLAPMLFALSTQAKEKSVFKGLKRLEYKESNRLLETIKIFDILKVKYDYSEDTLIVFPSNIASNDLIQCPKDHRMIHALIYLASVNDNEIELVDVESLFKSDLNILDNLNSLIDITYHKPQVLISVKSLDDLKIKADGYVMGYNKFTLFAANYFSFKDIKTAAKEKKVFVLLNALIHQNKLNEFKKEIDKLCELNVCFIFQDVGALQYLKTKIDSSRIIFNPYTLICQQDELEAYLLNSDVTFGISNEITLFDTYKTLRSGKGFLLAFGYAPMYQSYRKVLSLYENYIGRNFRRDDLLLKEDTRNEFYHVTENKYGTVIFRPYIISYLENMSHILNAKYLFLDSNFIDGHKFKKVIALLYKILDNKIDEKKVKEYLLKLNLNIEDGFKYQDSIYKEKSL